MGCWKLWIDKKQWHAHNRYIQLLSLSTDLASESLERSFFNGNRVL